MLLDYHEVIITKGVGGRGVGLSDYHEFITKGVGGRGVGLKTWIFVSRNK